MSPISRVEGPRFSYDFLIKEPAVSANVKKVEAKPPPQDRLWGSARNCNTAILSASLKIRREIREIYDVVSIRRPAGEQVYARVPHELHCVLAARIRHTDALVLDAF